MTPLYRWLLRAFPLVPYGGEMYNSGYRCRAEISRDDDVYMRRYVLGRWFGCALYLHEFFRGDADRCLHDHPRAFASMILSGGYWEETTDDFTSGLDPRKRVWYRPGQVLFRCAAFRHRIVLPEGRKCWSLVLMLRSCRPWGFWVEHSMRWVPWRELADGLWRCD
jgi:hypothetical protein